MPWMMDEVEDEKKLNDQIQISNKQKKLTPTIDVEHYTDDSNDDQQPRFKGSPRKTSIVQNDLKPISRGLVVICIHNTCTLPGVGERIRRCACIDKEKMEKIWKSYDNCEVLTFEDKTNNFYERQIEEEIREHMMSNIKYFILVLSTIGEEQLVGNDRRNPSYRHYFYTKNGMFDTQELMTKINEIEELQNRMKIFFIQAYRTRIHKEQEYLVAVDHIYKTKARTYEHGEDIEKIETSVQVEIPPCDDCVVVFPCMPGEPACHTMFDSAEKDGSWMLSALYRTLDKYDVGSTAHILDILTGVNRDMNQCVLPFRAIPELKEKVEQKLCEKNISEENLKELKQINKMIDELYQNVVPREKRIKHISELTFRTEKVIGSVELRAQLCFYHNLGFADDYMTLHKTKHVKE